MKKLGNAGFCKGRERVYLHRAAALQGCTSTEPTCTDRKLEGAYRLDAEGIGSKKVQPKFEEGENFSVGKHSFVM